MKESAVLVSRDIFKLKSEMMNKLRSTSDLAFKCVDSETPTIRAIIYKTN